MNEEMVTCPLCAQSVEELEYALHESVDRVVLDWIRRQHPDWVDEDGVCKRCVDLYRAMKSSGGDLSDTDEVS
ncbi:MAG: hypothetical protein ACE5HV_08495 [Acidobacteriota bacterium]